MSDEAGLLLNFDYSQNLMFQAQQMHSSLEFTIERGLSMGNQKRHQLIGKITPTEITARHQDTVYTPNPHDDRWTVARKWAASDIMDTFDEVRTVVSDVNGRYLKNLVHGQNRRKDETILAAFGGTAITGVTGGGTQALPAGQKILVNAHAFDEAAGTVDVGLTYYKLINALAVLEGAFGDLQGRRAHVAMPAKQKGALLASTKFSSSLYNQALPLTTGETSSFLGMDFHIYENSLILLDGSSDELVYVYLEEGVQIDINENLFTRITELPTKNYSWQMFASQVHGAVRLDDSAVIEIACDPTPTLG